MSGYGLTVGGGCTPVPLPPPPNTVDGVPKSGTNGSRRYSSGGTYCESPGCHPSWWAFGAWSFGVRSGSRDGVVRGDVLTCLQPDRGEDVHLVVEVELDGGLLRLATTPGGVDEAVGGRRRAGDAGRAGERAWPGRRQVHVPQHLRDRALASFEKSGDQIAFHMSWFSKPFSPDSIAPPVIRPMRAAMPTPAAATTPTAATTAAGSAIPAVPIVARTRPTIATTATTPTMTMPTTERTS